MSPNKSRKFGAIEGRTQVGGLSSSRATLSLPGAPAAAGRDPGEKDMEVALGSKAMEAVHMPRNPSVNC